MKDTPKYKRDLWKGGERANFVIIYKAAAFCYKHRSSVICNKVPEADCNFYLCSIETNILAGTQGQSHMTRMARAQFSLECRPYASSDRTEKLEKLVRNEANAAMNTFFISSVRIIQKHNGQHMIKCLLSEPWGACRVGWKKLDLALSGSTWPRTGADYFLGALGLSQIFSLPARPLRP